jgi:hypothetical protein
MLKEQLGGGGNIQIPTSLSSGVPKPAISSGDKDDPTIRQLEHLLREKDQMLGKTSQEKDHLAKKIQELERDMDRKLVNYSLNIDRWRRGQNERK